MTRCSSRAAKGGCLQARPMCHPHSIAHNLPWKTYCPPCQAQPSTPHLTLGGCLPINSLSWSLPILMTTHFSKDMGWGSRGLTLAEPGDCYDLPSWAKQLVPNTPYLRRLTSLKVLQAPLQAALQQLSPQVEPPRGLPRAMIRI
jgi:hypothetical protein